MVYDISLIYQQTVYFFKADIGVRSKRQSVAVMTQVERFDVVEIEQSLLQELTASDQSSSSEMMTQVGPMI